MKPIFFSCIDFSCIDPASIDPALFAINCKLDAIPRHSLQLRGGKQRRIGLLHDLIHQLQLDVQRR